MLDTFIKLFKHKYFLKKILRVFPTTLKPSRAFICIVVDKNIIYTWKIIILKIPELKFSKFML